MGALEKVPGVQNWVDRLPAGLLAAWHASIIYARTAGRQPQVRRGVRVRAGHVGGHESPRTQRQGLRRLPPTRSVASPVIVRSSTVLFMHAR